MLLRLDVSIEVLNTWIRRVVHEVEPSATRIGHVDRPAVVLDGEGK